MLKNQKGFSLAEVIVTAGILGGLALVSMQIFKNMNQSQSFAQTKSEELELESLVRIILNDEKDCRLSIAGNGPSGSPSTPVTFFKSDIDEDTEGLDVALFLSNQAGDTRTSKKLNGANNPGTEDQSQFGGLKIKTVKLIMNNGVGANYSDELNHTDLGLLRIAYDKKINTNTTHEIKKDFAIRLTMATGQSPESSGESRILGCHLSNSANSFNISTYSTITAVIPRNGNNSVVANDYTLCTLSRVASGGNNGGGNDFCRVSYVGRDWTLSGHRGDDPDITCEMTCVK